MLTGIVASRLPDTDYWWIKDQLLDCGVQIHEVVLSVS